MPRFWEKIRTTDIVLSKVRRFREIIFSIFRKFWLSKGSMIVEAALTLPAVCYIIFFSLEFIKVKLAQSALDCICEECFAVLAKTGKVVDFDEIFEKWRPKFIPLNNFRFWVRLHSNFETMMTTYPYGGESIYFPQCARNDRSPYAEGDEAGFGTGSNQAILSKHVTRNTPGVGSEVGADVRKAKLVDGTAKGYPFVLTITLHYPFSSAFVEKLFNGGSNTNKDNFFLLWSRAAGMINR